MAKSFTIPSLKVTYACRYYVFHALQAVVIDILELKMRILRLIFVIYRYMTSLGLPQWLNGKESTCNAGDAGDMDSISGWGRFPGGGHGNPLQLGFFFCLKNPMDTGD